MIWIYPESEITLLAVAVIISFGTFRSKDLGFRHFAEISSLVKWLALFWGIHFLTTLFAIGDATFRFATILFQVSFLVIGMAILAWSLVLGRDWWIWDYSSRILISSALVVVVLLQCLLVYLSLG